MFDFFSEKIIRIALASGVKSSPFDPLGIVPKDIDTSSSAAIGSLSPMVLNGIKFLIGILGIVFLVIVIYAGVSLILSKGNPDKIKSAASILTKSVIGIAIIFFSYSLIIFIMNILKTIL